MALYAQGNYVKDRVGGASRSQIASGVRYTPSDKLTFDLGINRVEEHQGELGFGNGLTVPTPITAPFGVGVVTPGFGGFYGGGSTSAINPGTGQTLNNTGYGWSGGNYGSWVGNGLAGVPVEYTALRAARAVASQRLARCQRRARAGPWPCRASPCGARGGDQAQPQIAALCAL